MNKLLFYIISFTWGLPMTLIGCVVALLLRPLGFKPEKWGHCYHFKVGKNWGGVNLGIVFITDETPSVHTKNHELGHGMQNCFFGPLMPFVVAIPSSIRYWYREYLQRIKKVKYADMPDYDSIWFEGQATKLGDKYYNLFINKESFNEN